MGVGGLEASSACWTFRNERVACLLRVESRGWGSHLEKGSKRQAQGEGGRAVHPRVLTVERLNTEEKLNLCLFVYSCFCS